MFFLGHIGSIYLFQNDVIITVDNIIINSFMVWFFSILTWILFYLILKTIFHYIFTAE
jgi:hypothetical protein